MVISKQASNGKTESAGPLHTIEQWTEEWVMGGTDSGDTVSRCIGALTMLFKTCARTRDLNPHFLAKLDNKS